MNNVIQKFLRNTTKETLMSYGKVKEVSLSEFEGRKISRDWLSMILIDGKKIKISFKVFFSESDVLPLILKKVGNAKSPKDYRGSFMNEFTNVTAGRIRRDLDANGYRTRISLPLFTRVLHGIEFFKIENNVYKDTWECKWQDKSIICSATLLTSDPDFASNFKIPKAFGDAGIIEIF